MLKIINQSHDVIVCCWESLIWLSHVLPDWQDLSPERIDMLLVGLKKSIGILRENYLSGRDAINKVINIHVYSSHLIYCYSKNTEKNAMRLLLGWLTLE
ncbi:MAG: hypothetical protein ABSA16_18545 [Thermoguttaceae bacterium]|jgi:hypothetical protein